jgi:hypothetical protein
MSFVWAWEEPSFPQKEAAVTQKTFRKKRIRRTRIQDVRGYDVVILILLLQGTRIR